MLSTGTGNHFISPKERNMNIRLVFALGIDCSLGFYLGILESFKL